MLTTQRKQHLLALLQRDGQIVAKALSAELGLSEDTIRRDLRELAQEGRLLRVHGGALPTSAALGNFVQRQQLASAEKEAIARAAAGLVRDGQVVFIDGGTTAVQWARALAPALRATVVTHSPSVAVELATHAHVEVVLIGGKLFKHSVVAVGATAIESIARFRAELYFMGVTGVRADIGLTTGDMEEASVKRALMAAAAETVVMASPEKLNAASPCVIAPLAHATTLVLAGATPRHQVAAWRKTGLQILLAAA